MDILPDSELALGILSNAKFTVDDACRIVLGLYPYRKRYTFDDTKHTDAWRILCEHYSPEIVPILGGIAVFPSGTAHTWGTVRCPTHALMCGSSHLNNNWLAVHAINQDGIDEAKQHLVHAGLLPTEQQALAKRQERTKQRMDIIVDKNLSVGIAVKSMLRCDTWSAVIVAITSDGMIDIIKDTGETRTVKPTAIQAQ